MDLALVQEYLEPQEVYEKRPARKRGASPPGDNVPDSVRMALYAVQHGVCPDNGSTSPQHIMCDAWPLIVNQGRSITGLVVR